MNHLLIIDSEAQKDTDAPGNTKRVSSDLDVRGIAGRFLRLIAWDIFYLEVCGDQPSSAE